MPTSFSAIAEARVVRLQGSIRPFVMSGIAIGAAAALLAVFVGYVCGDRTGAVLIGAMATGLIQVLVGALRAAAP